jgi:hypothetical protein
LPRMNTQIAQLLPRTASVFFGVGSVPLGPAAILQQHNTEAKPTQTLVHASFAYWPLVQEQDPTIRAKCCNFRGETCLDHESTRSHTCIYAIRSSSFKCI